MEWVETTGRTVEEAKDKALDLLGVDEQEAEFELLEDARAGLFGRVRKEARVRARVRPTEARPKVERRDRRSRNRSTAAKSSDRPTATSSQGRRSGRQPRTEGTEGAGKSTTGGETVTGSITLDEQAARMGEFLEGLLGAFDYQGTVTRHQVDDDTIELQIEGEDLGLLIGPKGQTLAAIQDLARVASTRDEHGPTDGRVRIDVGGYRERRRDALERFTRKVADEVLETGRQKVLEPMSPPDRKVVHDTVNTIDGVRTFSEGEDSRRRVVITPE